MTTKLSIYDSISLVCGDGLGLTYCGTRIVSFYDNADNSSMASLITFDSNTQLITIQPTIKTDYLKRSINFVVGLIDYPTISYSSTTL